jgi:hypothetical protein
MRNDRQRAEFTALAAKGNRHAYQRWTASTSQRLVRSSCASR